MKVRTRFAPSPTGFLHIGGVRTALFNYLLAKQAGGQFILRLEDTDRERFVPEGVEQIVESLDWLGLKPDDGFWISEGNHQNIEFVQSERHKNGFYRKFAEDLVSKGLAYYSPTSPAELDQMRHAAAEEKRPFLYRKRLDDNNTNDSIPDAPIRIDVEAFFKNFVQTSPADPETWLVKWKELTARGEMSWNGTNVDDFILIKSDGFPTYNFANVVDDQDMSITHVMRGDEFIASTAKHIILYHALGFEKEMPEFVHLPVINGSDGKKLSKRTGDTNVLDYRDKGYPPEALLNFLALLGWNDGTEDEVFTLAQLVEKFSLERINTSSAIFDQKRLDWISGSHIRNIQLDSLYNDVESFWPKEAADFDDKYKKDVLGLVQERLKYFAELPELTRFFFVDLPVDKTLISSHKQLKKLPANELKDLLKQVQASLEQSDFSVGDLTKRLNELLDDTKQKPSVLFSLVRIGTTWSPASPSLAETLAVLGKQKTISRISTSCDKL